MNCCNHPENEVAGACVYCGKLFCQQCLVEVNGKMYCRNDVSNLVNEAKQQAAPTNGYHNPIPSQPIIINNTNTNTNTNTNYSNPYMMKPKSKVAAIILCIFFGWLGIHRFYTGKIGTGLLYMFTWGFMGIGVLFDLILILTGSFRDKSGIPLR